MPTVLRTNGYRFFFYSNEGDPREPAHIHVTKDGAEMKIWLEPQIAVSESHGFNAREQRAIMQLAEANAAMFMDAWNDYFGD